MSVGDSGGRVRVRSSTANRAAIKRKGNGLTRPAPARDEIVADVERRIGIGEFVPGRPVTSESELAAQFAVSRGTVRSALNHLAARGLIESVPGKGWYPLDPGCPAHAVSDRASVLAALRAEAGARVADDPFLSEKGVCDRFGLSRHAARSALAVLEAEGLIVAIHGRGRFVAPAT